MPKDKRRLLVFDFDGTLADSLENLIEVYNRVLVPAFGCRPYDGTRREYWRGASAAELLREFKVPAYKLPLMVLRARREMSRRMDTVRPYEGICEVLRGLRTDGTLLAVLTSNSRQNVERFLRAHGIAELFDSVVTGRNLFGKAPQIRRLVQHSRVSPAQAVYIGDEVRDIEAGRKAGVRTIAVGWGFTSIAALQNSAPDMLVYHPRELASAVEQLLDDCQ